MNRLPIAALALTLTALAVACETGPPARRRRHEIHPEQDDPLLSGRRGANDRADDRWSMESMLPRSGDPDRPNVMVEVSVVDSAQASRLDAGVSVRGSFVRGVVSLGGSVRAGRGGSRARTSSSTFIVVQAGTSGSISLTDDIRRFVGPYQGIQVAVLGVRGDTVDVELAPFVAPTTRRGQTIQGGTRVSLPSGASMVIGGFEQSETRSSGGWGSTHESSRSRSTLAVLTVRILG